MLSIVREELPFKPGAIQVISCNFMRIFFQISDAKFVGNVVVGSSSASSQRTGKGDSEFVNPSSYNFFPSSGSTLKDAGDISQTTTDDFNASPRSSKISEKNID